MPIHFLNVDLEIESHDPLNTIVEAFGEDVINLYCGEAHNHQLATFEIAKSSCVGDADTLIGYFCILIDCLEGDAKTLWDNAFRKEFNIGYESDLEPESYESNLRPSTITRIADVGASIRITIYPPGN